jgi:GT2 family glycosyltransferase
MKMVAATPANVAAIEADASREPLVVVIVLMYGVPDQAIECVSSVMRSDYRSFRVILLDNASPDGAYGAVRGWMRGECPPPNVDKSPLKDFEMAAGPLDHVEREPDARVDGIRSLPLLTLVETGANLGYAGGNNIALRWLQANDDWGYAWILNPDAVVDPGAMRALVARCTQDPGIGPVGARTSFYDQPERLQQWGGGAYRKLRGTGANLGLGRSAEEAVDRAEVERKLDYVAGSSFFFPRAFLERAGLMDDTYFLYYEEADWCLQRGDMKLGYAHAARVYHRHGASAGSSVSYRALSPLAIRWSVRNRFRFARKFYPWTLPTVYLSTYVEIVRMIMHGAFANAWLVFKCANGLARIEPPNARAAP